MNKRKMSAKLIINGKDKFKWHSFGKHWSYKIHSKNQDWVVLRSPTMHSLKRHASFAQIREGYKEFCELELLICKGGFKGWISWTTLDSPHIMRLMAKIGAQPYFLEPNQGEIYFKKFCDSKMYKE